MIQTMPPMSTTNLPKLNSNFSIDWLVKGDKSTENVKTSEKKLPSPQLNGVSCEPLTKDYAHEVSTALRLQSPSNSDDLELKNKLRANSTSPHSETAPCFDYRNETIPSQEPHLIRPMAFMPSHPMHQQPTSPTLSMPLSPPMDAQLQQQQFINAQIQMAAALNYQRQATAAHPQALNFSQIFSNNFHRTSYQMQPWLLNRRFPYGFNGDFLLHPYRKPKRIRTAFAPMQLLELENAFEGNQYVVGSERKALAKTLNLTETQVKVWFQNRRTKHKRMQQEANGNSSNGSNGCNNRSLSDDDSNHMDDEQIDIEDTDDYDEQH